MFAAKVTPLWEAIRRELLLSLYDTEVLVICASVRLEQRLGDLQKGRYRPVLMAAQDRKS